MLPQLDIAKLSESIVMSSCSLGRSWADRFISVYGLLPLDMAEVTRVPRDSAALRQSRSSGVTHRETAGISQTIIPAHTSGSEEVPD